MASALSTDRPSLVDMANAIVGNIMVHSLSTSGLVIFVVILLVYCICCRRHNRVDRDVNPVPYDCLFIDTKWCHLLSLITWYCRLRIRRRKMVAEHKLLLGEIQDFCHSKAPQHPTLISASVKTSLDLFFRVQKYPPGSEVIVTAINSRGTIQVLLHHGLQVIPLDVNRDKLASDMETLGRLINENTVAIVVSHLFGRVNDLSAVTEMAHERGVHVLEDCSQACLPPGHSLSSESDLVFFSFGVTYPCTAFGGAITRIKDKFLLEKMDDLQKSYPKGSEADYIRKAVKCTFTATVLKYPALFNLSCGLAKLFRVNLKDIINEHLTASPSTGLVRELRERPSTSLTFMVHRRMKYFENSDLEKSRDVGDYVSDRLPPVACQIGSDALVRSYWLFPIVVDDPEEVCLRLNRLGIGAARHLAQMELITGNTGSDGTSETPTLLGVDESRGRAITASFIMDHIIYLPVHRGIPRRHLDQICLAVEIVLNKLAILQRYRASVGTRQVESRPGPYGTTTSRRNKELSRRHMVPFNRSSSSL